MDNIALGVLAGIIANKITESLNKVQNSPSAEAEQLANVENNTPKPSHDGVPLFKTYDAWSDLTKLLEVAQKPLISILIESQPSTFYRLATVILESKESREWFVFSRGRLSFEGTGGGINNSKDIINMLKEKNIPIGVWVADRADVDNLDNGLAFWPEVRKHVVPLRAVNDTDGSWGEIISNAQKFLSNSA